MTASYGDPDIFSLFGNWIRYRRHLRKSARTLAELRAAESEIQERLERILSCALAEDARAMVPDNHPIPDRTLLVGDLTTADVLRFRRRSRRY